MTNPRELAKEVEVRLIAADIRFLLDVVFNSYLQPLQGTAMLSLMPFFSSFMIDSAEYLRRNGIGSDEFLRPHQRLLRTSRLRLKPLEEFWEKPFEEVLNEITQLVEMNSYWFLGSRPAFRRFLQRLFWGDMGVFFVGTEVFSTTHVSSLNIGLTKEIIDKHSIDMGNLGTYLRETSVDLGRYTGALAEVLGVSIDATDRSAEAPPPTLGYSDYLSDTFYRNLSASMSPMPAVSVLVTALLSQTNFAGC